MLPSFLTPAVSALAAVLAATLISPAVVPDKDLTNVPPDASAMEAQIASAGIDLAKAIEAAVKAADGAKASSAALRMENGKAKYDVALFGGGKAWLVVVDGANGEASAKTIPPYTFPGDAVTGTAIETPSKLRYYELREGTGAAPAGPTTKVKVHYTGWLLDGTKFDSSVDRGQPIDFALNGVIAGWTEGVGSMKVGGKRKLVIPYTLGYGERGNGRIPGKATLVFDVELIAIVN